MYEALARLFRGICQFYQILSYPSSERRVWLFGFFKKRAALGCKKTLKLN
jgi:hypothetical protein